MPRPLQPVFLLNQVLVGVNQGGFEHMAGEHLKPAGRRTG